MEEKNRNIGIRKDFSSEGLGASLKALYDGMEGLVGTKTVIGDPMEIGGAMIVPLVEVSAGLASGSFTKSSCGAMNAKITPIALLVIENGRTRLISVKNQDVFTKLIDLIPEAVDKIRKGSVSEELLEEARNMAENGEIEIIEGE